MARRTRAPWSSALAIGLTVAWGPVARSDNEDEAGQARLTVSPIASGGTAELALRSNRTGKLGAILVSAGNGPLVGKKHFVLDLDIPFYFVTIGALDASGLLKLSVPIGDALSGITFFAQGLVVSERGPPLVSNPVKATVDAADAASFRDATGQLPPSATREGTQDTDSADLDGDGDLDQVLASRSGALIYINDGSGLWNDETDLRIGDSFFAACVELGDVDLDGDLDLVVGASPFFDLPAPNELFLNDGQGSFTRQTAFPPGRGATFDAELGDVDTDGDLDLVLANGRDFLHPDDGPDPDQLLINQGGRQAGMLGLFVPDDAFAAGSFNNPAWITRDATLGDIDNDGDLDVFLARFLEGVGRANVLLKSDGMLGFLDVSDTHLVPRYVDDTLEAELVDVNGDGWLDLVLAQSLLSVFGASLMVNQGGGVFLEDAVNFPQLTEEGTRIRIGLDVADVEGDGDPDVCFSIHFEIDDSGAFVGESLLFLNQGGAQAGVLGRYEVDATFPSTTVMIAADAAFVDIDHDGDPDLHLASFGDPAGGPPQDRLLINDQ